jgi:diguanylate cyclase (GGDEF)-like protein
MVYKSTDKLKEEEIYKTEVYAHHIAEWITKKTDGEIEKRLTANPKLREHLNEILETFLIPKYQYIFLLSKDEKSHYRFLLDGSKEEKEEYQTIFFPRSSVFDEVYREQKVRIVKQKDLVKGVWLSLLYPIVIEGKTRALLILDLSKWYGEYIENFNSPLSNVIWLIQIFLLVSFLVLVFISYRYYHLRKKVLYDPLTHAQTKLFMEEFFNRNRVDQYHAMLIDIDEFKEVNRIYGYENGDKVLREFVSTLRRHLPKDASVIRIGGAEFFVFFSKNTDLVHTAKTVFEKTSQKSYTLDGETLSMTLSASAMEIPDDTVEILHVLHQLDEALLKIKSSGKNRLSILNFRASSELKQRTVDYIKEALEEERLICYYQPVVNTEVKEIQKFEALVRLVDKDDPNVLISPASFIDMIKGTSQYIKMSKLVLKQVFTMSKLHKI